MQLQRIVTLANRNVRLRFLAMERSLRATGCALPLLVIPYEGELFDLPQGSEWWSIEPLFDWLRRADAHPTMRKYQALTLGGYQFVDADVCFLRNPEEVLSPVAGFVTSCGHWRDTTHTCTRESEALFRARSTNWQRLVFNSGQFAADAPLYTTENLIKTAENYSSTCITWPHNEQPGMNLLVSAAGIEPVNLTLPPFSMESTWAGDYGGSYEHLWETSSRKPYLIHWAGVRMDEGRPIDEIFLNFLTHAERDEWARELRIRRSKSAAGRTLSSCLRRLRSAVS